MRNLHLLDIYRRTDPEVVRHYGWTGDETGGVFMVPSPVDYKPLLVIASTGGGWDHVSVSRLTRCPNWPEMSRIRELFFNDDEVVMQLHVPKTEHINLHPYCLHLWRPHDVEVPKPPGWMLDGKGYEENDRGS